MPNVTSTLGHAKPHPGQFEVVYEVPGQAKTDRVGVFAAAPIPDSITVHVVAKGDQRRDDNVIFLAQAVPPYDTFEADLVLALQPGDRIEAMSDNGAASFTVSAVFSRA